MGYIYISIGGSDMAADCHAGAVQAILDYYFDALKHRQNDNSYNTPTSFNVAMSINSIGKNFFLEDPITSQEHKLFDTLEILLDQDYLQYKAWHKEEQDDNSHYHITEFGKIRQKFLRLKKAIYDVD